jgi:hypothetical protein
MLKIRLNVCKMKKTCIHTDLIHAKEVVLRLWLKNVYKTHLKNAIIPF